MVGINDCKHEGQLPDGVCPACKTETCSIGTTNCRCAVGYPYELQCHVCRDDIRVMNKDSYCVCRPSKTPPRL